MEYYVADSYKDYERVGEPFEKNDKLYTTVKTKCDRCVDGIYPLGVMNDHIVPSPVDNGVCYKCHGTGFVAKEVRLYTEKEKAAMDKAKRNRLEKKAEERRVYLENLEKDSEKNLKVWFEKNGFSEDGFTYCAIGNTYSIKDLLKENGFRYNSYLSWHRSEPFDMPIGYGMVTLSFDDIYTWNPMTKTATQKMEDKELQNKYFYEESKSEFMGEEKERLYDLSAILTSIRETSYGLMYSFLVEDNVLVWFTSKELDFEEGAAVTLTGTVKRHDQYHGVKTTYLNRCIVKQDFL